MKLHNFQIKFKSKQVAERACSAFGAVSKQSSRRDGKLGAVFCQLRECDLLLFQNEHGDEVHLSGSYLPPKWAAKIGRVLEAYEAEQKQEAGRKSVLRRRK